MKYIWPLNIDVVEYWCCSTLYWCNVWKEHIQSFNNIKVKLKVKHMVIPRHHHRVQTSIQNNFHFSCLL